MPPTPAVVLAWAILVAMLGTAIAVILYLVYLWTSTELRIYRKRQRLQRIRQISSRLAERMTERVSE